jgi:hypothetical protein
MSLSWTHQIAKALATERPTLALELHLDALLVWLSNPDNPRVAELERAIGRQRLARDQAGASAYRLLDRQLFADETAPPPATLGFVPGTAATQAKQRYRRLMQVYHPDRHPERTAWATRRTEQINRAFAAFQRGETGTAHAGARRGQAHREASKPSNRRLPPAWLPPALRDLIAPVWVWTHDRWLALTPIQQRLSSTAAIICVLMLTIAFWPEEPPRPVPRIIHHPLGIEPTPALVDEPAPEPEPQPPAIAMSEPTPEAAEAPQTAIIPQTSAPDASPSEAPIVASKGNALLGLESSVVPETAERERSTQERPAQAASEPKPEPLLEPKTDAATPAIIGSSDRPTAPPLNASPPGAPSSAWSNPMASLAPHAEIPAAATPEPPKPPAPPETPLALGTAPAVSNVTAAGTSVATECQTAPEILSRFQNAYQSSALDRLMALYSPLAKENELATWFAIRQTYAEWFRTTSSRHIGFEQIQVQPIADSRRCALMAVFQVSYLDRQSRLVTQAGIIELLLERKDSDWLILRARY